MVTASTLLLCALVRLLEVSVSDEGLVISQCGVHCDSSGLAVRVEYNEVWTALIRPGDRQGPGQNEMAQTTSYQHFWDPGGSETVGDDLLHLPDAAVMLKVKAKVKKSQGQKFHILGIA